MRAVPVMLFALLAAMLAAGCISSIGSTTGYTDEYVNALKARVPLTDSTDTVKCKDANCVCMVCKKGSSLFVFFTSLAGGSCYFDSHCDPSKFKSIASGTYGKNIVPNYFRIGQGPSFSDFGAADPWCDDQGGIAVQWLIGAPGSPYALPSARRALCMLDKGVIPVYVLYSGGKDINIDQTSQIANVLGTQGSSVTGGRLPGPVGPVIVTTEMNYDAGQAAQIKKQIEAINAGCRNNRDSNPPVINCMVAVAPRLGDYAALDAVMKDPATGQIDPEMNKSVDLVAYGIDSNTMSLAGHCTQPSVAWENATAFSRYALYNLTKASVIPYVLFDAGGTDASGSCTWSEATMIDGYSAFFNSYVQALPALGVIGVAAYSFNSSSLGLNNPLGCKDCDLARDSARMRSWFAGCQAYVNLSRKVTNGVDSYPSDGALIRYPDQPSGSCQDDTNNIAAELINREYTSNGLDADFTSPVTPQLRPPPTGTLFSCDECVSDKAGAAPFKFPTYTAAQTACTQYPELDSFASQRSLDPTYVRAVVASESGNQQCAIAKVCKANSGTSGCFNPSNSGQNDPCYAQGYNTMSDPSSTCSFTPSSANPPNWRFCGLGLMQVLEPPYDYWPAQYRADGKDGPDVAVYNDAVKRGMGSLMGLGSPGDGMAVAKACDPTNFNPFNTTDAACAGTAILAQKMVQARKLVAGYHNYQGVNLLNWFPTTDVDKDSVFAAYVAANLYVGTWNTCVLQDSRGICIQTKGDKWVGDFWTSWTANATYCSDNYKNDHTSCSGPGQPNHCFGYTDFVTYVHDCETNNFDPGAIKMGYYYSLRSICKNSQCPDWQALYNAQKAAGGKVPQIPAGSGDLLLPDVTP